MGSIMFRTFRFFMEILTIFILFLCILCAINPFYGDQFPILENCSTILPLTLIACFFLIIYWAFSLSAWVFVPIFSILINIGFIGSVYQISRNKNEVGLNEKTKITICTYNIKGLKYGNIDLTCQLISEFAEKMKVDLLCFQEFDTASGFSVDSIKNKFKNLEYKSIVFGNKPGFGLAVFSKFPIIKTKRISFASTGNQAMLSELLIGNYKVKLMNFHLQTTNFNQVKKPFVPGYWFWDMKNEAEKTRTVLDKLNNNFVKRLKQGEIISSIIDSTNCPILVCGDMNANPASFSYYQIKSSLIDGFREAGIGYEYTYRMFLKLFRTDYIFHSDDFSGINYKSYELQFSDHKPVVFEMYLK